LTLAVHCCRPRFSLRFLFSSYWSGFASRHTFWGPGVVWELRLSSTKGAQLLCSQCVVISQSFMGIGGYVK
jgi:hypothetical protein